MNDYKFGNFLCSLRENKEMTQAELAQILSVTPAAVSKWENGESKPRLETLFKVAEIFEVSVEELMSGEFICKDDEIIDEKNSKKYDYLIGLEKLLSSKVRILRVCAFVVDWNIIGLPIILSIIAQFLMYPVKCDAPSEEDALRIMMQMFFSLIVWFCCFVLRDLIFKGRSPGKRIFGLTVIDRKSGGKPEKKQLILRNLFLFLQTIDGIIMLIRGMSIGDSVAQTLVVLKKDIEENEADTHNEVNNINGYVSAKKERKKVLSFLALGAALYAAVAVIMFSSVFRLEKSEPYMAAYNYLVESDSFKKLDVNEERIKWTSISGKGLIDKSDTNEVTFLVEGKEYTVVSHNENGVWIVCEECTDFR